MSKILNINKPEERLAIDLLGREGRDRLEGWSVSSALGVPRQRAAILAVPRIPTEKDPGSLMHVDSCADSPPHVRARLRRAHVRADGFARGENHSPGSIIAAICIPRFGDHRGEGLLRDFGGMV
ncbi:hypothetical protein KM043_002257 [Ampulex compressa]|nr:hypothetical protein KM043_002257 [Ampulex compressa]